MFLSAVSTMASLLCTFGSIDWSRLSLSVSWMESQSEDALATSMAITSGRFAMMKLRVTFTSLEPELTPSFVSKNSVNWPSSTIQEPAQMANRPSPKPLESVGSVV